MNINPEHSDNRPVTHWKDGHEFHHAFHGIGVKEHDRYSELYNQLMEIVHEAGVSNVLRMLV